MKGDCQPEMMGVSRKTPRRLESGGAGRVAAAPSEDSTGAQSTSVSFVQLPPASLAHTQVSTNVNGASKSLTHKTNQ